ncbi:uncharacterized protein tbc1d10c isoform 1-T2 [Aulostomus maculatus]
MLSPTGPAQRNFSEEDSSGSDAGSEVSLEPEIDRFGFLVTDGSTARTVGPHPQLVRQREAKWISIIDKWEHILLKRTSKVKVQCQKGIPASLRAKCWPLLCGASDRMKNNQHLYKSLDSQPALQNWVDIIERDLNRQFPFHEMFLSKDGHGQRGLFRVLKAYTQYQPEDGYCQAQGPVAAVLLMNMPAEEAFWCLVQISEQYLPGYYSPLLEGVLFDAAVLTWVLKRTCPSAHKHLQHHGVEPLMFATDWLMCLFTRHLPFNTLLRVWDLFFCYGVRVLLQVAVVLVRRVLGRAEQRKQCQGQLETLERLRAVREEVQEDDDAFVAEVCSVPLSARDLERHMEKTLEKWREDRPKSTFDPRGRCRGYQMAWARAHHSKEETDRKERERGNLSVPVARSASTISLSPSVLHKKWWRGGKGRELPGGTRVVRHLSMGAKDDWRSWNEEQEEDLFLGEHNKQSELKLTRQTEQTEEKLKNVSTQHVEIPKNVQPQIEEMENDESRQRESEERKSEQTANSAEEDTPVKTEPAESVSSNLPLPADHKEDELGCQGQQSGQQDTQGQNTRGGTVELLAGREQAAGKNQTEVEKDVEVEKVVANTSEGLTDVKSEETENVQQVTELIIESDFQTIENAVETETQQQEEAKYISAESLADMREESHLHRETVEDSTATQEKLAADVQTDAEQHSHFPLEVTESDFASSPESTDENEPDADDTKTLSNVVVSQQSETESDTMVSEPKEENEEVSVPSVAHLDSVCAHVEEMSTEPEMIEEESNSVAPMEEEEEDEEEGLSVVNLTAEMDGEICIVEIGTVEECAAPQHSKVMVYPGDEDKTTDVQDNTAGHTDVSSSSEQSHTDRDIQVQNTDDSFHSELSNNSLTQESEQSSCLSSVDVCKRSSSSCGTQVEETATETLVNEEVTDSVAPLEDESLHPGLILSAELDGKTSTVELGPAEECAPSQPSKVIVHPDVNAGENDTSTCPEQTETARNTKDNNSCHSESSNSGQTKVSGRSGSLSSGDVCIRKSSSSRVSRSACRLSDDLFTSPQKTKQSDTNHPEQIKNTAAPEIPVEIPELRPSKHFSLFRRLKGEQPRKNKGTSKMQVPKILIQDFSGDQTEVVEPIKEEEEEKKLSSRERRKKRREQERREKEEEKLRKKREKELKKKERERKKPQTRGKSFQVQREKGSDGTPRLTHSQTFRYSASYDQSYF